MKIRALAQHREGHGGFFRGGLFWSSTAWTECEVDERTLAALKSDPRLMVEAVVEAKAEAAKPELKTETKGKG